MCLTQGHGLPYCGGRWRPLIRSSAHVPDQPIQRRQFLHWFDRPRRSRGAILATVHMIFMGFRELTSARGNALLQLF